MECRSKEGRPKNPSWSRGRSEFQRRQSAAKSVVRHLDPEELLEVLRSGPLRKADKGTMAEELFMARRERAGADTLGRASPSSRSPFEGAAFLHSP